MRRRNPSLTCFVVFDGDRVGYRALGTPPGKNFSNLDFEQGAGSDKLSEGWNFGSQEKGHEFHSDNVETHGGQWSVRIDAKSTDDAQNFAWVGQCASATPFSEKHAKLSGFIKTSGVAGGYAGLWIRVDAANGQVLGMDNMQDRGLTDTRDWSSVSASIDVPKDAAQICVGGLLTGGGTAWIDDLSITE